MERLSVMIGYSCCILILCLCSCGLTLYSMTTDYQSCLTAYSRMQPGTTTEAQFKNWVKEASVYTDNIDGKKTKVYRCGWVFSSEYTSKYGTMRHYRIVRPYEASEFGQPTPTITLYSVAFDNGILSSLSTY